MLEYVLIFVSIVYLVRVYVFRRKVGFKDISLNYQIKLRVVIYNEIIFCQYHFIHERCRYIPNVDSLRSVSL